MSAAVFAGNVKLNNVKIILASGYEMNVLTSKTKIADILDDNHIILLEDEKVLQECKEKARALASRFPLYPDGYFED